MVFCKKKIKKKKVVFYAQIIIAYFGLSFFISLPYAFISDKKYLKKFIISFSTYSILSFIPGNYSLYEEEGEIIFGDSYKKNVWLTFLVNLLIDYKFWWDKFTGTQDEE
jgi:hypothetical protein